MITNILRSVTKDVLVHITGLNYKMLTDRPSDTDCKTVLAETLFHTPIGIAQANERLQARYPIATRCA